MAFGPPGKIQGGAADLWFNPAQSGWGISLHQQYSTMFATWFLYDEDGAPTWLFMPDAAIQNGATTGDVLRARGVPGMPFQAAGVTVSKVGTANIANGQLSATVGGVQWASSISRLPF